jgi:hypothetical protein
MLFSGLEEILTETAIWICRSEFFAKTFTLFTGETI